jgi:hypothetical protein
LMTFCHCKHLLSNIQALNYSFSTIFRPRRQRLEVFWPLKDNSTSIGRNCDTAACRKAGGILENRQKQLSW